MSKPVPQSADWTGDRVVDSILDVVLETVPEVRVELGERRAFIDRENPSGERVRAADEFADMRFEERLLAIDGVASYASEERSAVVTADGREVAVGDDGPTDRRADGESVLAGVDGDYHLAVDPLDGSSNLRSNNPMGTIVGVYDEPLPTSGRNLVASAYVLYGPNTTLTVTDGDAVTEYLVVDGERRLLNEDLTLPEEPTVYGVGGRRPTWPPAVDEYVDALESEERLKLRYGGALIADVTQVLTHGGVFAYPELADRPEGKLRYHFECAPMGFLIEAAGGRASDGQGDLLDREPDRLHERTPFYVGNSDVVRTRERL